MSSASTNGRHGPRIMPTALIILVAAMVAAGIHRVRRHAYMSVTPSTYSECKGPDIVAHVKWDMRGTAAGHDVFVSAYQVGKRPKVFDSGPLVGESDTGEWAADGTTILLTDEKNRLLAERTIESTDCPSRPVWPQSP